MNLTDHLVALQVVVPLLAAPLIVLLQARLAWAVAALTSIMALIIAIVLTVGVLDGIEHQYLMGSWPAPYGIELGVDALSAVVLLIVTGASSCALLAGFHSLDTQIEPARQPLFYAAWVLALAGLSGICGSGRCFQYFCVYGNFLAGQLCTHCWWSRQKSAARSIQIYCYGYHWCNVLPDWCGADLHDDGHTQPG